MESSVTEPVKAKSVTLSQVENTPALAKFPDLPVAMPKSKVSSTAKILFPFVRDDTMFVYQDGAEIEITSAPNKSTVESCNHLANPMILPNKKYIVYLQQISDLLGYGGCNLGIVRIFDIDEGVIRTANFVTSHYSTYFWTNQNLLFTDVANPPDFINQELVLLDPKTMDAVVRMKDDSYTGAGSLGSEPIYSPKKMIVFHNKAYWFKNGLTNQEVKVADDSLVSGFQNWSPDGKYAIFSTHRVFQNEADSDGIIWLAFDIANLAISPKEIMVSASGAGGEPGTTDMWYFDKAFVTYCSESLAFLDGSVPLQLTNSGGGGCNNQEGFVATSPEGKYAFVKFSDRFELHDLAGNKQVVNETKVIQKNRSFPKNMYWLDDNYMVMFDSPGGGMLYEAEEKPKIRLYNRSTNTLKPIVEDGYLVTGM